MASGKSLLRPVANARTDQLPETSLEVVAGGMEKVKE